jgi:DNA-binding response OmpR family regulator
MRMNEQGAARRIIALDDSSTVLATVRIAFEKLGLEVITAEDPSELSPDEFRKADLIVVDVQMVHVFGDDIVTFLREDWQVDTPIYLYSGLAQDDLERRASAAGADGAVSKSLGVNALVARVKHLLDAA